MSAVVWVIRSRTTGMFLTQAVLDAGDDSVPVWTDDRSLAALLPSRDAAIAALDEVAGLWADDAEVRHAYRSFSLGA